MRLPIFVLLVCLAGGTWAFGCVGAQSRAGKLQDAAQDLNMGARFGRMDVALEHVSSDELDAFAARHAEWGGSVRIADVEYRGMRFVDDGRAEVYVMVAWQRLDEQQLRVTLVTQDWSYERKAWKLRGESRAGGDAGLLGEPVVYARPTQTQDVHLPSIRIR